MESSNLSFNVISQLKTQFPAVVCNSFKWSKCQFLWLNSNFYLLRFVYVITINRIRIVWQDHINSILWLVIWLEAITLSEFHFRMTYKCLSLELDFQSVNVITNITSFSILRLEIFNNTISRLNDFLDQSQILAKIDDFSGKNEVIWHFFDPFRSN